MTKGSLRISVLSWGRTCSYGLAGYTWTKTRLALGRKLNSIEDPCPEHVVTRKKMKN